MNCRYLYYLFISSGIAPFVIGVGFIVSGSLIVGLANANIKPVKLERVIVKAKKLDINDDGFISLEELTKRQAMRFRKLDSNDNGQIDKTEFNARLVTMFNQIDTNNDKMLDDNEISKLKIHGPGKRL